MKTNRIYYWVLFFVWPFIVFLISLRKGLNKNYQPFILAFSFLFGYTVFLSFGDIIRYERSFYYVYEYQWSDYWHLMSNILDPARSNNYTVNSVNSKPDIFALSMQFFISRFTDNPRWFWAFVSLFYTYFMIIFINEVKKHSDLKRINIFQLVFIVYLVTAIPFYRGVTGVRFWTGMFLYLFFIMRYFGSLQNKYILLSGLTILIHYTFIIPVSLLVAYSMSPNKKVTGKLLTLVCLPIFFITSSNDIFSYIGDFAGFFSDTSIESNLAGYIDQDLIEKARETGESPNWYVTFNYKALPLYLMIVFALELVGLIKIKDTSFSYRMQPFIILYFCLSLFTYNLTLALGRFIFIFSLLLLARYIIVFSVNKNNKRLKAISLGLVPLLCLHILVSFRAGFYYVDPMLLVHNSISAFFVNYDISLSELIIGH